MPQLLYTLLSVAGIKCSENPALYTWRTQLGIERRLKIDSFEEFVKNFGIGVYQVYVTNPEISGFGETFEIKSLSVTVAYEGDGKWSDPRIQTEEEEITLEFLEDFALKTKERAIKIATKVKDVLSIFGLFVDATRIC